MILYLDLFLLLNGGFDLILLYFTGRFRQQPIRWWRLLCAATLGSLYAVFLFFPQWGVVFSLPVKLLVATWMCWIAFGYRRFRFFIQIVLTFFLLSFSVGGGILGLHFLTREMGASVQGGLLGWGPRSPVSWYILGLGMVLMLWSHRKERALNQQEQLQGAWIVKMELQLFQQKIQCQALIDTGNRLVDPFSGTPVILVEGRLLQQVLPSELVQVLKGWEGMTYQLLEELPPELLPSIRLIPFRGAVQGLHLLLAVKPEQIKLSYQGGESSIQRVWVGIHPENLAADGSFQAILHPHMIMDMKKEVLHA